MEAGTTPGRDARSAIGLLLGPALAVVVALVPIPALTRDAHLLAVVMVLVVVLWITEALPLPVTALLGVALAVVLGIADTSVAFGALGNEVIFLFIGSFILARAMSVHGLDRRIAFTLLSFPLVERSPLGLMVAFGVTAAGISMWVSNTATVAMLLPVALAVGQHATATPTQGGPTPRRYTAALLFTLAYAASLGGLATPVGTPPNLIGIALIREFIGRDIPFFQWVQVALPVTLLMLGVAFAVVAWFYRPPVVQPPRQPGCFRRQLHALGPMTRGERNTVLTFLVAVALLAAVLLFVLPVDWRQRRATLSWEQAAAIDWGTVLLFGGGIALGRMMLDTGLAAFLGEVLLEGTRLTGQRGVTAAAVGAASVISEAASNTASANIVVPVMASLAQAAGVDALVPALGATMGTSMGVMLPVSTPPNALVYGTRQVSITEMVRNGIILDIAGGVTLWVYLSYILPLWFT